MPHRNRRMLRGGALLFTLLLPAVAQAAKEKFVRDKPHVNIGTIGRVDSSESLSLTLSLVALPGSSESSTPRCSGHFQIRILDSEALAGPALVVRRGIELQQNRSYTVDATPASSPGTPLLHEVIAKGEQIDGRHCVFRGIVEVRSRDENRTTRAIDLRPEDFIVLNEPDRQPSRP